MSPLHFVERVARNAPGEALWRPAREAADLRLRRCLMPGKGTSSALRAPRIKYGAGSSPLRGEGTFISPLHDVGNSVTGPQPGQTGTKKRQTHPPAVRANLDDPPIHIRPGIPASAGAKNKKPCGFMPSRLADYRAKNSSSQGNSVQKMPRVSR